jgi:hypothetical protein
MGLAFCKYIVAVLAQMATHIRINFTKRISLCPAYIHSRQIISDHTILFYYFLRKGCIAINQLRAIFSCPLRLGCAQS